MENSPFSLVISACAQEQYSMDSPPVETAMLISRIDGRLTIIMALVVCFLLWSLKDRGAPAGKSPGAGDTVRLRVEPQGHPVLDTVHDLKVLPAESGMPARYLPFFFRPLPINSVDKELLMTVKGIGPQLAETIVRYRHQVGPITNILEFQEVPGVGHKRAMALANDLVFDEGK